MFDDFESDEYLDFLCEVDISVDGYKVKVFGYKRELYFEGALDEFDAKYNTVDNCI